MKLHKNQRLLTMSYPLERLARARSRGQTMAPEGQKPSQWLHLTELPSKMYSQPIVHKALSRGTIRRSACILAEITIRKSQGSFSRHYARVRSVETTAQNTRHRLSSSERAGRHRNPPRRTPPQPGRGCRSHHEILPCHQQPWQETPQETSRLDLASHWFHTGNRALYGPGARTDTSVRGLPLSLNRSARHWYTDTNAQA